MTPEQIDHVFGRGRLKMETGPHVEVFREAAPPGESRRYTKRFLTTADGDYAQWTEREWRILALLIGHGSRCVPDVVQYDRDARGTKLVQTYDAGATVDQWATLLPVKRRGHVYARVFEDCAHWWALAHHCLVALDEIHTLQLVHLDVKGDNICIPIGPANFDPAAPEQWLFPDFPKLTLIDFAFSLVSGESLPTPLPIGWQHEYDYQSPRLLHALEAGRAGDLGPTENLDWRCDMYSLAAMLKRYLPGEHRLYQPELACGWTAEHYDAAKSLILRIREAHDRDLTSRRPHSELIVETSAHVRASELAQSLEQGWKLARDAQPFAVPATPLTPITRLAPSIRLVIPPRDDLIGVRAATRAGEHRGASIRSARRRNKVLLIGAAAGIAAIGIVPIFADSNALLSDAVQHILDAGRAMTAAVHRILEPDAAAGASATSRLGPDEPNPMSSLPNTPPDSTVNEAAGTAEAIGDAGPSSTEAGGHASMSEALSEAGVTSARSSQSSPSSEPSQSTQPPASLAPLSSQALPTGDSRSPKIEGYRSKSQPRGSRIARAPSSATSKAARASPARPAESTRRTQLAGTKKVPGSATPARTLASRSSQPLASKRSDNSALVASRMPTRTQPTPVASAATSASPIAVVLAPVAGAEGPPIESKSPNDATTGTSTVGQNVAPAPPTPPLAAPVSPPSQERPEWRVAAPSPPAVVTPQVAPAVEPPRPSLAAPNNAPIASGMAPIVEASRPLEAPIVQAPRQPPPPALAEVPRFRPSPGAILADDVYPSQARWTLENVVPRTSAQSRAQIERVLWIAASAYHPAHERAVIAAAAPPGVANDVAFGTREVAHGDARRLHEEARQAYWSRRDVPDAFDLELKAFGANPNDPEIAGQLALLHLKVIPAQPERARQLALHAIGMRNGQYRTGRPEDWTTFAIASALTGREMDARNGLYASVALTGNVGRVCRAALGALASYGDRVRKPVEALFFRLRAQGRDDDSPDCAWRPDRLTALP